MEQLQVQKKREPTMAAQTAKAIRKELKEQFPNTKFSVRAENFSGGNAVDIEWIDKQTSDEVDTVVKKYQYGNFNGMIDCYEYNNKNESIPQVRFVQVQRKISDETMEKVRLEISKDYGIDLQMNQWYSQFDCYGNDLLWREVHKKSFL